MIERLIGDRRSQHQGEFDDFETVNPSSRSGGRHGATPTCVARHHSLSARPDS
jgi:hypothetical protein